MLRRHNGLQQLREVQARLPVHARALSFSQYVAAQADEAQAQTRKLDRLRVDLLAVRSDQRRRQLLLFVGHFSHLSGTSTTNLARVPERCAPRFIRHRANTADRKPE
jgi:hypothetical protein